MSDLIKVLGKKWNVELLEFIRSCGNPYFRQIYLGLPDISTKILAERLKELRSKGLLVRQTSRNEVKVRYLLSERGLILCDYIKLLKGI